MLEMLENFSSRTRKSAVVVISTLMVAGLVLVAPPVHAAPLSIGVQPSANGYVMKNVPTQIAIAGTPSAKIYFKASGKWRYQGVATPSRALPYTFGSSGIQTVLVKPKKGKSKTFKVAVYYEANFGNSDTPMAFGGVVFPRYGSGGSLRADVVTLKTAWGCVSLNVGAKKSDGSSGAQDLKLDVLSTTSAPWSAGPTNEVDGLVGLGIPVSGDTVITVSHSRNSYLVKFHYGVTATCLNS